MFAELIGWDDSAAGEDFHNDGPQVGQCPCQLLLSTRLLLLGTRLFLLSACLCFIVSLGQIIHQPFDSFDQLIRVGQLCVALVEPQPASPYLQVQSQYG